MFQKNFMDIKAGTLTDTQSEAYLERTHAPFAENYFFFIVFYILVAFKDTSCINYCSLITNYF